MFIYNLVILFYAGVIRIASLFKQKAKYWVDGRSDWRKKYAQKAAELGEGKRIWVHCASYGEFEQGRPLLEAIRLKYPDYKIILSFFSPSGYEAFNSWKGADMICYLPLDTRRNAADFLKIIDPSISIFIKYEFWINFLNELRSRKIRTFLVSAVFKPHHPFFKWYGGIFKSSLSAFELLDVQDQNSFDLLKSIDVKNVKISGDTRFDRVLEVKRMKDNFPLIEGFVANKKVLVAGSTYARDHEFLLKSMEIAADPDWKLIIVPHEVDATNIKQLKDLLKERNISTCVYSENETHNSNASVLIIDIIGILSKIYRYAHVTYIGGGFNDGWHNVLEPSVYGLPVILYGKDEGKFNEISELIALKTIHTVESVNEFEQIRNRLMNSVEECKLIKEKLELYFKEKANATEKILLYLDL